MPNPTTPPAPPSTTSCTTQPALHALRVGLKALGYKAEQLTEKELTDLNALPALPLSAYATYRDVATHDEALAAHAAQVKSASYAAARRRGALHKEVLIVHERLGAVGLREYTWARELGITHTPAFAFVRAGGLVGEFSPADWAHLRPHINASPDVAAFIGSMSTIWESTAEDLLETARALNLSIPSNSPGVLSTARDNQAHASNHTDTPNDTGA